MPSGPRRLGNLRWRHDPSADIDRAREFFFERCGGRFSEAPALGRRIQLDGRSAARLLSADGPLVSPGTPPGRSTCTSAATNVR